MCSWATALPLAWAVTRLGARMRPLVLLWNALGVADLVVALTRYGEMISARVSSVDLLARTWQVTGKTGSRTIILQQSAVDFFGRMTEGRDADEFLFTMADGGPWEPDNQTKRFKAALKSAGLPTDGSLYALRHSYISRGIKPSQ